MTYWLSNAQANAAGTYGDRSTEELHQLAQSYLANSMSHVNPDTLNAIFLMDKNTQIIAHTNPDTEGSVLRGGRGSKAG